MCACLPGATKRFLASTGVQGKYVLVSSLHASLGLWRGSWRPPVSGSSFFSQVAAARRGHGGSCGCNHPLKCSGIQRYVRKSITCIQQRSLSSCNPCSLFTCGNGLFSKWPIFCRNFRGIYYASWTKEVEISCSGGKRMMCLAYIINFCLLGDIWSSRPLISLCVTSLYRFLLHPSGWEVSFPGKLTVVFSEERLYRCP